MRVLRSELGWCMTTMVVSLSVCHIPVSMALLSLCRSSSPHCLFDTRSSNATSKRSVGRYLGTWVCIRNKLTRVSSQEYSKMIFVLQSYCIISTGVRITCTNQMGQGKRTTVLCTSDSNSMRDNIGAVFGPKQVRITYSL